MDGVVDEKNRFALALEFGDVEFAIFGIQHQMQRMPTVGYPFALDVNFFKIGGDTLVPGDAFLVGRGLGAIAAFKTCGVLAP